MADSAFLDMHIISRREFLQKSLSTAALLAASSSGLAATRTSVYRHGAFQELAPGAVRRKVGSASTCKSR